MTASPRELAEEALRDDAKATAGPWTVETVSTQVGHCHKIMPLLACIYVDGQSLPRDAVNLPSRVGLANANLIAAARTREPLLAAALLRALDECAEMRRSLEGLLTACREVEATSPANEVILVKAEKSARAALKGSDHA